MSSPRHGYAIDMLSPPKPRVTWTVEQAGSDAIVQLRGEIDLLNASELESVLGGLVRDGVERVVLDFDGVDSIDSSGLRAIVSTANGLSTGTRCVRVIRPRESIRSLFDATGLTHLFRIDHPA